MPLHLPQRLRASLICPHGIPAPFHNPSFCEWNSSPALIFNLRQIKATGPPDQPAFLGRAAEMVE